MPIKVGTEVILGVQESYLEQARRARPESKLRLLYEIVTDRGVVAGRETLHPEWIDIYRSVRELTKNTLPARLFQTLERALTPFLVDAAIGTVDPNNSRLAFLLGAGASKPKPSDIPTVKELLPDLLTRARRLDRADLHKLADFCDEVHIDNIEDLLTAAQLAEFCSRNPSVLRLVDFLIYRRLLEEEESSYRRSRGAQWGDLSGVAFLQDTLQLLFGLLSSRMLPALPNPGHTAMAEYVKANPNSAIITTNYDCCMDLALRNANAAFSYLLEFANSAPSEGEEAPKTSLVKLHGSLNWFYCQTCQQVHLIDIERTVKEYMKDEGCYSVVAVCKDCGGQRRGLVVPPLAVKFDVAPPLTPLIGHAQDSFNAADVVVVIGFSFAAADMYISRMLSKSMQLSDHVRVVIFDPDYEVVGRLRRQFSLRIPEFEENRVMFVMGDCAETLPRFLEGKLMDKAKEDSSVAETSRGTGG